MPFEHLRPYSGREYTVCHTYSVFSLAFYDDRGKKEKKQKLECLTRVDLYPRAHTGGGQRNTLVPAVEELIHGTIRQDLFSKCHKLHLLLKGHSMDDEQIEKVTQRPLGVEEGEAITVGRCDVQMLRKHTNVSVLIREGAVEPTGLKNVRDNIPRQNVPRATGILRVIVWGVTIPGYSPLTVGLPNNMKVLHFPENISNINLSYFGLYMQETLQYVYIYKAIIVCLQKKLRLTFRH